MSQSSLHHLPPDPAAASPHPTSTTPSLSSSPSSSNSHLPADQPLKLKGRRRLIETLQRMSSSSSLTKARLSPSGYRGSSSCVALSGSSSIDHPQLTAATVPNSPASAGAFPSGNGYFDAANPRIRFVQTERDSNGRPRAISVPVPADVKLTGSRPATSAGTETSTATIQEVATTAPEPPRRSKIDFWGDMPDEIKVQIFSYLRPKEIIRCAAVCQYWNRMCFDGQLWTSLDTSEFYRDIPSDMLVKIITAAGPFVRNMNLRGCLQMHDKWIINGNRLSDACRNLTSLSVEDCRIDRTSIHYFLLRNPKLVSINISKMTTTNNSALKIIAQGCPHLESLNVSWCSNVDSRGVKRIIESCPKLSVLKASELRGLDDRGFMLQLFKHNNLEQLILDYSQSITDDSFRVLFEGVNPQMDFLTGRPIAPDRKLVHLDISGCPHITDEGLRSMGYHVPDLQVLRLAEVRHITDRGLTPILESCHQLKYLDLDELEQLTNTTLTTLARSQCAAGLEHLSVSYCEKLGDPGMLNVVKSCKSLNSLVMDNTHVSDLCLMEASTQVRARGHDIYNKAPKVGLNLVVYDCQHVTWAGVREVMNHNAQVRRLPHPENNNHNNTTAAPAPSTVTTTVTATTATTTSVSAPRVYHYPLQIIQLKCFFGWQQTVNEHTKRVLRGDFKAAIRLERKWTDYMMASEEAGAGGGSGVGARRRQRRMREARRLYDDDQGDGGDEDDDGLGGLDGSGGVVGGVGMGRRRARSGGCVVM